MPVARFQLPDGRVARFEVPKGTTPEDAQKQIEAHLSSTTSLHPQSPRLKPVEMSGTERFMAQMPFVPQSVADVATGASGLMRGTANLLSGGRRIGDVIWPKARGSEGSIGKTVGQFLDPVSLAIGGGVLKAIPYAK